MKVTALARLSTVSGWKLPGDEFVVNQAEAEALVARGLVEPSAEGELEAEAAPSKPRKPAKSTAKS